MSDQDEFIVSRHDRRERLNINIHEHREAIAEDAEIQSEIGISEECMESCDTPYLLNPSECHLLSPCGSGTDTQEIPLPTGGILGNQYIQFQLIPISEIIGRSAVGDVYERKLRTGDVMKIGRQIIKDGQVISKGNKKPTDIDVWYTSKVVSRLHAEIWTKDGQLCVKDVGSSSGTFLNQMRLSPSGKGSRPYPLKQGDILQFGVDFKVEAYRAVTVRLGFFDQSWLKAQKSNSNPQRFSVALKALVSATNPYGDKNSENQEDNGDVDCCICIGAIAPYQALFISPCSHCYHFKCVGYLIAQSPMFQCPMCRQVANLTASVSSASIETENLAEVNSSLGEDQVGASAVPVRNKVRSGSNAQSLRRSSLAEGKRILETFSIFKSGTASVTPASAVAIAVTIPPAQNQEDMTIITKREKKSTLRMKIRSFVARRTSREGIEVASAGPRSASAAPRSANSHQHQVQGPSAIMDVALRLAGIEVLGSADCVDLD